MMNAMSAMQIEEVVIDMLNKGWALFRTDNPSIALSGGPQSGFTNMASRVVEMLVAGQGIICVYFYPLRKTCLLKFEYGCPVMREISYEAP